MAQDPEREARRRRLREIAAGGAGTATVATEDEDPREARRRRLRQIVAEPDVTAVAPTRAPTTSWRGNTARALGQSTVESFAAIPGGIGAQYRAARRDVVRGHEALDEGRIGEALAAWLPDFGRPEDGAIAGFMKFGSEVLQTPFMAAATLRQLAAGGADREALDRTLEETDRPNVLQNIEAAMGEWAREAMPTDPAREEDFTTQLARGLGSVAGFATAAAVTRSPGAMGRRFARRGETATDALARAAKARQAEEALSRTERVVRGLTPSAHTTGLGGAALASEAYRRAEQEGADTDTALEAAQQATVLGTAEGLQFDRMMERALGRANIGRLGRQVINLLRAGAASGAEELIAETLQQAGQNDIVRRLYNPDQKILEGLGQAATVGGATGFLATVLLGGLRTRGAVHRYTDEQGRSYYQIRGPRGENEPIFRAPEGFRGSFAKADLTMDQDIDAAFESLLQQMGVDPTPEAKAELLAEFGEQSLVQEDNRPAARALRVEEARERGPIYTTIRYDSIEDDYRKARAERHGNIFGGRTGYEGRVIRQPDGSYATPDGVYVDPARVYRLDSEGNPVPISVPGEQVKREGISPIVAAAIKVGDKIGKGPNHFFAAVDAGLDEDPDQWNLDEIEQGFVDADGNFWTRAETEARTGRAGESGAQGLRVREGAARAGDPLSSLIGDLNNAVAVPEHLRAVAARSSSQVHARALARLNAKHRPTPAQAPTPRALPTRVSESDAISEYLPRIGASNFFSRLERVISRAKIEVGNAADWKGLLNKANQAGIGVSKLERLWTGIDEILDRQDPKARIAKADLLTYIRDNAIQVEEVVRSQEPGQGPDDQALLAAENQVRSVEQSIGESLKAIADQVPGFDAQVAFQGIMGGDFYIEDDGEHGEASGAVSAILNTQGVRRADLAKPGYLETLGVDLIEWKDAMDRYTELLEDLSEMQRDFGDDYTGRPSPEQVQFAAYTLAGNEYSGGQDYREIVIRLPSPSAPPTKLNTLVLPTKKIYVLKNPQGREIKRSPSSEDVLAWQARINSGHYKGWTTEEEDVPIRLYEPEGEFTDEHHFQDITNPVVHMRVRTHVTADGRRLLAVEEIQSDWAQTARRLGQRSRSPSENPAEQQLFDAWEEAKGKVAALEASLPHERSEEHEKALWDARTEEKVAEIRFAEEQHGLNAQRAEQSLRQLRDLEWQKRIIEAPMYQPGELPSESEMRRIEKKLDAISRRIRVHEKRLARLKRYPSLAPSSPFANTEDYVRLAARWLLQDAARNGYDGIAISPGVVQVERWHSDYVSWDRQADGSFLVSTAAFVPGGPLVQGADPDTTMLGHSGLTDTRKVASQEALSNLLSKIENNPGHAEVLAESLWKQMQREPTGSATPRATGISKFYDEIVVQHFNQELRPFGLEIRKGDIADRARGVFTDEQGVMRNITSNRLYEILADVEGWHRVDFTPEALDVIRLTPMRVLEPTTDPQVDLSKGSAAFFSRVLRAISNAPFQKGSVEQWQAHLKKDVAAFEVDWIGLNALLATADGTILKTDLLAVAEENRIILEETEYGGPDPRLLVERLSNELFDADRAIEQFLYARFGISRGDRIYLDFERRIRDEMRGEMPDGEWVEQYTRPVSQIRIRELWLEVMAEQADFRSVKEAGPEPEGWQDRLVELAAHMEQVQRRYEKARADARGYKAVNYAYMRVAKDPKTTNYREIVVRLGRHEGPRQGTGGKALKVPTRVVYRLLTHDGEEVRHTFSREEAAQWQKDIDGGTHFDMPLRIESANVPASLQDRDRAGDQMRRAYRHGHWEVEEPVLHLRLADRILPDGTKELVVEEVQSDWSQQARRYGVVFRPQMGRTTEEVLVGEYLARMEDAYRKLQQLEATNAPGVQAAELDYRVAQAELQAVERGVEPGPVGEALRRRTEATLRMMFLRGQWSRDETLRTPESVEEFNALAESEAESQKEYEELLGVSGRQYMPPVERTPFANTSDWADLAIRRIMLEAAKGGHSRIRWTPGAAQFKQNGSSVVSWKRFPSGAFRVTVYGHVGGEGVGRLLQENIDPDIVINGFWPHARDQIYTIRSLEDLRRIIPSAFPESTDEAAEKRVQKVWEQMQAEPNGFFMPRYEGMASFYDSILAKRWKEVLRRHGIKDVQPTLGQIDYDATVDGSYALNHLRNQVLADYSANVLKLVEYLGMAPQNEIEAAIAAGTIQPGGPNVFVLIDQVGIPVSSHPSLREAHTAFDAYNAALHKQIESLPSGWDDVDRWHSIPFTPEMAATVFRGELFIAEGKDIPKTDKEREQLARTEATTAFGSVEKMVEVEEEIVATFGEDANVSINGIPSPAERLRAAGVPGAQKRAWVSVIGKLARSYREIHKLFRPFRDPRQEHLHYILLNDRGQIVHRLTHSSGAPHFVNVAIDMDAWADLAHRLGATRMIMVHNHPTGQSKPSRDDVNVFEALEEIAAGHGITLESSYVIDHDNISVIARGPNNSVQATPWKVRPDGKRDWTDLPLGKQVEYADEVLDAVKEGPGSGYFYAVFTGARSQIISVARQPLSVLDNPAWIARAKQDMGAMNVIFVSNHQATPGSRDRLVRYAQKQMDADPTLRIMDVVDIAADGNWAESAVERGQYYVPPLEVIAARESVSPITQSQEGSRVPTPMAVRESNEPYGSDHPLIHQFQSTDPLERAAAALKLGAGQRTISRLDMMRAIIAAKSPDVLSALQAMAPQGRGAYQTERWLDDVMATDEQHADKVRSPYEIIVTLAKNVGVPIVQEKTKRWKLLREKGVAGAYRIGARIIRLNQPGDIEAAAHEVGHFVHELVYGRKKGGGLRLDALTPEQIAELNAVAGSVSGGGPTEGIAEFFRRFVTNPDAALTKAPKYHEAVVAKLESEYPEVMEALLQARQDFHLWRTASDVARVQAMISHIAEVETVTVSDKWTRFKTAVYHNLIPIRDMEVRLLPDEDKDVVAKSVHDLAMLRRGIKGAAEYMIKFGMIDYTTRQKTTKSLEEIIGPIIRSGQHEAFSAYAVLRRARERLTVVRERDADGNPTKVGYDVGLDLGTVERGLAKLENQEFKEAFDELVEYNLGLLKYLKDGGVIDEATYNRIVENSKDYVPFHRVTSERKGSSIGRRNRLISSNKVVRRFFGDTADIIDPLESIMQNTYLYTQAVAQHRVGQALMGLAEQTGAGSFLDVIHPAPEVLKRRFEDVWEEINEETGGALGDIPEDAKHAIARFFRPGDFFNTPNTIAVRKPDGKLRWYEVRDPDLYDALMNNEARPDPFWAAIYRFFGTPARWLRAGAILNPEYMLRNPYRDQMVAWFQSENGYIPFWDLGRGVFEMLKKGDLYRQWKVSGGEYATLVDLDRASIQKHLENLVDEGNPIVNVVKHPIQHLQAFSAIMENATRIGEFARALEKEMGRSAKLKDATPEQMDRAALAARNITTDYAKHGAKLLAIRSMATFWNAGLQGTVRFIDAMRERPSATSMKVFMGVTLPSLLLYWVNRDDEEYFEIPRWQRDLFWMIKVPVEWVPSFMQQQEDSGWAGQLLKPFVASNDGVWIRIPKPFDIGVVFGTVPERIFEWIDKEDPKGFQDAVGDLLDPFTTPLFGGVPDIVAVQPLIENWANRSRFLRRPLVPKTLEELSPQYQVTSRTSEFARAMGKWLSPLEDTRVGRILEAGGLLSPIKIDNLMRSWTAGLGGYATAITNPVFREVRELAEPGTDTGARPARGLPDMPGIKAFIARDPGFSSESIHRFYEHYIEARQAKLNYDHLMQSRRVAEAMRYYREHQADIVEYQKLEMFRATLVTFQTMARMVESSPGLSAQEKAEQLERLGEQATAIAAAALGRRESRVERMRRLAPQPTP